MSAKYRPVTLERHAVPPRMQVVHGLHGHEDGEVKPAPFLRELEAQIELVAARDHVLDHAIDRVLVRPGELGHKPPDVSADAMDEARGLRLFGVLAGGRKEPA